MDKERFEQQLAFILEADKEKNILRQTHLSGHGSSARYSSTLTERTFYEATRLENGNVLRI